MTELKTSLCSQTSYNANALIVGTNITDCRNPTWNESWHLVYFDAKCLKNTLSGPLWPGDLSLLFPASNADFSILQIWAKTYKAAQKHTRFEMLDRLCSLKICQVSVDVNKHQIPAPGCSGSYRIVSRSIILDNINPL